MRNWVALSGLLACQVVACAPAAPPGQLTPTPPKAPPLEDAIRAARTAFYQAATAGDVRAIAAFFAQDGMLILGGTDTIRGRAAIEHYLGTARPSAVAATVRFDREPPLQACTDGAFEQGVTWAELRHSVGTADTLTGRFTVRWARDSLGNVQVQWADLSSRSQTAVTRSPRTSECIDPDVRRALVFQKSARFAVTLLPGGPVIGAGAAPGIESAMIAQGWKDPTVPGETTPHSEDLGRGNGPTLSALRYRLSDALSAELIIGPLPRGSTFGENNGRSTQLTISWSGTSAGAVLSYERWGFRVGAGPALRRAQLHAEERPYSSFDCPSCAHFQATSQTSVVGLVADLAFRHAVWGRIEFDVIAQARRFGKTTTPQTPNFTPASVDYDGAVVGFGFGVLF